MELFASYTGRDFLLFYGALLAASVLAGIWIAAWMRPDGRRAQVEEAEEAAILAGGIRRHAMTVMADLMAKDAISASDKGAFQVRDTAIETGSAGRSVLRTHGEFKLADLKRTTKLDGQVIEERLIKQGLMMDGGERLKLGLLAITPYAALFALGLYRQQAGAALGEPTGFLALLLFVTLAFAIIRFFSVNPRTKAGHEALRDLESQASRLKRAPQPAEAGFAVALFGTAVLVGTPWAPLHAAQRAGGGDTSASGDGGDGGGGCGGGCGGCGG